MEEPKPMTLEEIQGTIRAAQDSVWVITDTIQKLQDVSNHDSLNLKETIERNVAHLKIVTTSKEISDSGEDISDLLSAIEVGEAKLAEDIWSTE